jgi:formylmethanofuran dehydrogenase subunit C
VSALVFRLKSPPRQRVDVSPLTPDGLSGLGIADIVRVQLVCGNQHLAVGELFEVTAGDATDIVIRDSCERLDCIGAELDAGSITVEGDAGAYLGRGLRGGRVRVSGNAGPWAAARMRGGTIEIAGHAGDCVGGALPGEMRGMNGGRVFVNGSVGDRAGDRMRRGLIAVGRDAGAYTGSRMIAGTVLVLGRTVGVYPGFAMKRGTLLMRAQPARMLPTFADAGTHDLGFLTLLARSFDAGTTYARELAELGMHVQRYIGDGAAAGKGEILVWSA